jgi:hypothetical protein
LGIREFRFEILGITWPVFFIISICIIGFYIIGFKIFSKNRNLFINNNTILFIVIYSLFIAFQFINSFRSDNFFIAIIEVFKSAAALLIFVFVYFIIKYVIKSNVNNLNGLFKPAILVSTIILCILIYRYYFVFNSTFLGINFYLKTELGKNQLAFYLGLFIPIVISNLLKNRNIISLFYLIIHLFAIIYIDSKGVVLSLIVAYLIVYLKNPKKIFNRSLLAVLIILFITILIFVLTYFLFNYSFIRSQLIELNLSNDFLLLGSTKMRLILAVKSFFYFFENPLIGIGTMDFLNTVGVLTHNSYLQILCEQGIIGMVLFLGSIYLLLKSLSRLLHINDPFVRAINISSLVGVIYLLFINAFNIFLIFIFWSILFSLDSYYLKYEQQEN